MRTLVLSGRLLRMLAPSTQKFLGTPDRRARATSRKESLPGRISIALPEGFRVVTLQAQGPPLAAPDRPPRAFGV
jgi:hypothetical protein